MLPLRWLIVFSIACSDSSARPPTAQKTVAIRAQTCGALCGDRSAPTRDPRNFTGMDCATAARVRVVQDGKVASEKCIEIAGNLGALFDAADQTAAPAPVALDRFPQSGKVSVEVALYAPGGELACPGDGPMVGLGRSAEVDLAQPPAEIDVPLGCHELCGGGKVAMAVSTVDIEDQMPFQPIPSPLQGAKVGEIHAYAPLTATAGVCAAPSSSPARGEFRAFQTALDATDKLEGDFARDPFSFTGCVALHLTASNTYACITLADPSTAYVLSTPALQSLVLKTQTGEQSGSLVTLLSSPAGMPLIGARLSPPGGAHVDYLNDTMDDVDPGLTATGISGIAIVRNAPTGTYSATDGTNIANFTAGGVEPGSATTIGVQLGN